MSMVLRVDLLCILTKFGDSELNEHRPYDVSCNPTVIYRDPRLRARELRERNREQIVPSTHTTQSMTILFGPESGGLESDIQTIAAECRNMLALWTGEIAEELCFKR